MRFIALLTVLLLIGCGESNKDLSDKSFTIMCSNYELAICGDLKGDDYVETSLTEIRTYTRNNFYKNRDYFYQADPQDTEIYSYMYGYPMYGDCEDFTITILENLILLGMIEKGEAVWMFGDTDFGLHAWLLITKGDVTWIFDNIYWYGIEYTIAYKNYNYVEEFVVYTY